MDGSAEAAIAPLSRPANPGSEAELLLEAQKRAFAEAGAPGATKRRALLDKLERALLSNRAEIARAISEDFGHRSSDETELLELVPSIKAIRHAKSHLVRWISTVSSGLAACRCARRWQPRHDQAVGADAALFRVAAADHRRSI